ncbi:hypothetical protein SRABI128_04620 [Microbacterium sp. Bi128]|nr:hypothetical protein SRABI128_04620 [Microbacterium sp. Bi128]
MFTTLPKLTFAAKGMLCPLSSDTVSATHVKPPSSYALLIGALNAPPNTEPSGAVHSGIVS